MNESVRVQERVGGRGLEVLIIAYSGLLLTQNENKVEYMNENARVRETVGGRGLEA